MFIISSPWLIALGLNSLLLAIAFAVPKKLLTLSGYLHACILGVIVWGTLGWRGYAIVMFYFLVGSAVTKIGMEQKEAEGIAEKRSGQRGPENVWGSAAVGTICALGTLFSSEGMTSLLILGYVASFCTKLSDTAASEIGKAYGKRTYLITTLKSVARGTEGAVSLEGTIAGFLASLVIAFLAWGIGMINGWGILWCAMAAFVATTIESWIGATIQSKWEWLTNEMVNGINTAIGAVVAIFLSLGVSQWR